jgi:hypothetical protein
MLLVGFTAGVLIPATIALGAWNPKPADVEPGVFLVGTLALMFGAPLALLVALDWICRRVVADRPGKFDPKTPTVGKWTV